MTTTPTPLLVLVPTPREAALLFERPAGSFGAPETVRLAGVEVSVALCGLGLAAAGAAAATWISKVAPRRILLAGLCGTFDRRRLPIGGVLIAESVACDGIGADEGVRFAPFAEPQLAATLTRGGRPDAAPNQLPALDRIILAAPEITGALRGALLSVAASAGSPEMVATRRRRHPNALAEEMEGYAVALAALLAGIPLTIVRGACNVAGDRDHRAWKIPESLAAVRAALVTIVQSAVTTPDQDSGDSAPEPRP